METLQQGRNIRRFVIFTQRSEPHSLGKERKWRFAISLPPTPEKMDMLHLFLFTSYTSNCPTSL